MEKVLNRTNEAGSRESHEPRLIGDIIKEMFRGNSPLAENSRKFFASKEKAEKGGLKHE